MELRNDKRTERKKADATHIRRIGYVPMAASVLVLSWRTLVWNVFVVKTWKMARIGEMAPNAYQAAGALEDETL